MVSAIESLLERPDDVQAEGRILAGGLAALPMLREFLSRDLDFASAEHVESIFKKLLKAKLALPVSGREARELARFQRDVGFVLKYKSYAVKAASPLGYSLIVQNEGEGFSFQRHVTHKTELFHILDVTPGGFVFLCEYGDWVQHYEPNLFAEWLNGKPHPFFDRCRRTPKPGDVFVVSELGTVHTAIGCSIEEFATVSTDMVDRLHDQNAGKITPEKFNQAWARERLRALRLPDGNRLVDILSETGAATPIGPETVEGGERRVLTDSFVQALTYRLSPNAAGAVQTSGEYVSSIRIYTGTGTLAIASATERDRIDEYAFEVGETDLLLMPPGMNYRFVNTTSGAFEYSEHRILPQVAFI